jgi:predicted transcriptional regulator
LSIEVQTLIVENPPCRGGEYLLLLILSRHGNADGTNVCIGVERMARETNQTRRNVQRQLRGLEEKGLIVAGGISGYGTVNYRIALEKLSTIKGGVAATRLEKIGATNSTKGATFSAERGVTATPDSSSNSSYIQKQEKNQKDNPKVKTDAVQAESMKHIRNFLPTMKKSTGDSNGT